MRPIHQILLTALLLTMLTMSIHGQQLDQTFSGIQTIQINTSSSDCVLKKSSGDQVNVKLTHNYGDNFKPSVEKSGSKLIIKESHQKGSNHGKGTWTLSLPDGLALDFNTGSGDFQASSLEVRLSLNAGSGDFSLNNIKGRMTSNAGSGDLEVLSFSGELQANVGSGNLEIEDLTGPVELNSGSGDIELSGVNGKISANVGSGDIEADRVTLDGASAFNSGSGDVTVELAASPGHDLSVNSGSGDSRVDFNGHTVNATLVMTADKNRGSISAPFNFEKEEEIENHGQTIIKKTTQLGNGGINIKIGAGSGEASVSK